jgi:type IV pilus assembly protein PilQ
MIAEMSRKGSLFSVVLSTGLLLVGAACRQVPVSEGTASGAAGPRGQPAETQRVRYSPAYDAEIESILELARKGRWEQAQEQADMLLARAPEDSAVQRLHSWVSQQRQAAREKALEDKIREIDARNSVFNPTIPGLLTENKDRGLPASKDVRDTIEKIETSRIIPETYGTVRREKGPLFDLAAARGPMAKLMEKEVTIHLDNVTLENLIVQLSQITGINIVADKSLPVLKQTLSVNVDKVRLSEFLRYVERNYEVQFQVGPELVWVTDAKDPKKLMEETRFYRLRTGFVRPARLGSEEAVRTETRAPNNVVTVTETQRFRRFVNDEAPESPSLEQAITNFFTGKWYIDYERNLIVARGTPEQLEVLERLIEEFDRPIQQVLIEARFVTISKPAFLQLGLLWETGRALQGARVPQDFTGLASLQSFPTVNNVPAVGIGLQEVFTNILGRRALSATLSALEQSGESQTISAPRLTVLNNRPATISDGKVQYYYEEYQVKQTVQQYYTASSWVPSGRPTKITAGAELNVLASIAGDGKHIILALNPRVNTDVQLVPFATLTDYDAQNKQVLNSFTLKLPEYRTQELATRVVVRSGETVVMGGVLERERTTMVEAVPVLGNIPVIGAAFRRRTEVDKPRYLLIFVTATIVNEKGEFVIYED